LPENLQTTYRKTLIFRQQMSGQAEIITDDLRLIERFLNPIKAIFDK
jgi:HlyD family secretion protein